MKLINIAFRNDGLEVIEDTKSIVVKDFCEVIGLKYRTQYDKLRADKSYESELLKVQTNGGIQEVFTIPLSKLNGWLFSISPNKVKPEVREKLIEYKKECFDVLHNYFNKNNDKHQHHVVIGYKSQLAQKNKKIRLLEDENEALLECESIALFNGVHKNTLGRKNQQLQNENQTLQANNHNLKLELNNIKKSIHYTSADVLKLVEKGLKYDRLNDDYCNLYQKYQDINSHLNKIKPLMQSIVNINNENQMQIEF